MRRILISLPGIALSGLFLTGPLAARADTPVKSEKVPAEVKRAIDQKYAGAKQKGWETESENGKTVYEVKLVRGKEHLEVSVTPEGKIASEETEVAVATVPEPVKAALHASAYGKWKVRKAERILEGGDADKVSYELAIERTSAKGRERAEVVFDPAGKMIKEERPAH